MIALTRRTARTLAAGATLLIVGTTAEAQGTLSGLGFGYPVGGNSTRAAATGGSFAEFDALSPRNPASVGGLARPLLAVQAEPEYRTLRVGNARERTTAQRIPLLFAALPLRRAVAVGLSASTFLDRSYTTVTRGEVVLGGDTFETNDRTDVRGSIGDLRAAIGWRPSERVAVGVGGHLFTGDNVVASERQFPDTTEFGSVLDTSRVTYFGTGVSVGAEVTVGRGVAVSASYRSGFGMDSRVNDSVRTRANVPNRIGAALRYDGIPGSIFAIGVERQEWTRMRGLGSALVEPRDATNWSAGAEVAGPRLRGSAVQLRAGYARNALPFGIGGRTVSETRFTGGFGVPLGNDAASFDFSLQRANRTLSGGDARESAWMVGLGVQVRIF